MCNLSIYYSFIYLCVVNRREREREREIEIEREREGGALSIPKSKPNLRGRVELTVSTHVLCKKKTKFT